jgi:exodeoxyribonuclease VII large subunit
MVRRLDRERQSATVLRARLERQATGSLRLAREQLAAAAAHLRALSPAAILTRGYAIVEADGHVLHDAAAVQSGQRLRVHLHHGRLLSTVDSVEPDS